MERRIEHRNLGERGMRFSQRADGIQLERLMRRYDRYELLKFLEHFFIDECRPIVSDPALHYAMTDGNDLEARLVPLKPSNDKFECFVATAKRLLVPITCLNDLALRALGSEARL